MNDEIKKMVKKQYVHYFRFWFIALAVLLVIAIYGKVSDKKVSGERNNAEASKERVFDYADKLTDEEEATLSSYISEKEEIFKMDIALVLMNEDVEKQGDWNRMMKKMAEQIYTREKYGYDKVYGDGVLLLDNWYQDSKGSQKGSYLSLHGRAREVIDREERNKILDKIGSRIEQDPYSGYKMYVDQVCELSCSNHTGNWKVALITTLFIPIVITISYAWINVSACKSKKTATVYEYVNETDTTINDKRDVYVNKNVEKRVIQSNSERNSGGSHGSSVDFDGASRRR